LRHSPAISPANPDPRASERRPDVVACSADAAAALGSAGSLGAAAEPRRRAKQGAKLYPMLQPAKRISGALKPAQAPHARMRGAKDARTLFMNAVRRILWNLPTRYLPGRAGVPYPIEPTLPGRYAYPIEPARSIQPKAYCGFLDQRSSHQPARLFGGNRLHGFLDRARLFG
jgi:hypothetical protein